MDVLCTTELAAGRSTSLGHHSEGPGSAVSSTSRAVRSPHPSSSGAFPPSPPEPRPQDSHSHCAPSPGGLTHTSAPTRPSQRRGLSGACPPRDNRGPSPSRAAGPVPGCPWVPSRVPTHPAPPTVLPLFLGTRSCQRANEHHGSPEGVSPKRVTSTLRPFQALGCPAQASGSSAPVTDNETPRSQRGSGLCAKWWTQEPVRTEGLGRPSLRTWLPVPTGTCLRSGCVSKGPHVNSAHEGWGGGAGARMGAPPGHGQQGTANAGQGQTLGSGGMAWPGSEPGASVLASRFPGGLPSGRTWGHSEFRAERQRLE